MEATTQWHRLVMVDAAVERGVARAEAEEIADHAMQAFSMALTTACVERGASSEVALRMEAVASDLLSQLAPSLVKVQIDSGWAKACEQCGFDVVALRRDELHICQDCSDRFPCKCVECGEWVTKDAICEGGRCDVCDEGRRASTTASGGNER